MRNAFKYRLDLTDYCFNEWNEPKFKKKRADLQKMIIKQQRDPHRGAKIQRRRWLVDKHVSFTKKLVIFSAFCLSCVVYVFQAHG